MMITVLVTLFFQSAFAQPEQHSYFVGTIGDRAVQAELVVDNGSVSGSFYYDDEGTVLRLEGQSGNRGELSARVLGDAETVLGMVEGVLEPTRFEGTYTPSANASELRSVVWQEVAEFVTLQFNQDILEAETVFPHFTTDASILNSDWQPRALENHLSFAREGQDYLGSREFLTMYFLHSNYDITYYSPDLISVLESVSIYAGGAHPNIFYNAYNVGIGQDAVPFMLGDVLSNGGLDFVAEYVLDDLREQGAESVVDGAITTLGEEELRNVVVSPAELRIHFAPYAVASYAAGTFEVLVPWEELEPYIPTAYIPTDSPFARFL